MILQQIHPAMIALRVQTVNMWMTSTMGAIARRLMAPTRLLVRAPCMAFGSEKIEGISWGPSTGRSKVPEGRTGDFQGRHGLDWKRGDWRCDVCSLHVFAFRQACPRCNTAKDNDRTDLEGEGGGGWEGHGTSQPGATGGWADSYARSPRASVRNQHKPGDWDCPSCQFHNFASRHVCYRCKGDRPRGVDAYAIGERGTASTYPAQYKPGDWECPSCKAHNYASRQECFRCKLLKTDEAKVVGVDPDRKKVVGGSIAAF